MKKILISIFSLFIFSSIFAQQTMYVKADYDAAIGYHYSYTTNQNNYGNAVYNGSYCIDGTYGGYNVNRALIHFDLSQIPHGAEIVSASISLFSYGPIGTLLGHEGTANTSYLKMVTESWQENTVTWDNQPSTTSDHIVTLHQSSYSTEDYINIDMTDMVKAWYNSPSSNYGVLMGLNTEASRNSLIFCSTEYVDTSKHPVLKIIYTDCRPKEYSYYSFKDAAIGYHDGLGTENNNYGNADYLAGYCLPGTSYGLNVNRGLFYFDISAIPISAELISAQLSLYAKGQSGTLPGHIGSANSIVLQRIVDSWSEYSVSWNSQPSSTSTNEVILAPSSNSLQDYLNVDVTTLVSDMIQNPASSYGFLMKLQNEVTSNAMVFCSTDYPDSTKWPKLKLTLCSKTGVEEENKSELMMKVYPNPASTDFMCSFFKNDSDDFEIAILNSQGQLVYSRAFRQLEPGIFNISINIENLSDGLYFVSYRSNTSQAVHRLLISR